MYEIELDIYSGRPNPRWYLTAREGLELEQRILDGVVPAVPSAVTDGRLGYRGFIVRATGEQATRCQKRGQATEFRVRSGLPGSTSDTSSERFLLQRLDQAGEVTEADAAVLSEAVASELSGDGSGGVAPLAAAAGCSLLYTSWNDFSFWNGSRKPDNNCYNYASNYASNTFAQPGRASGQVFTALTVANIKAAMRRDGWVATCSTSNLRVALVIWPGQDYHFYRKNLNAAGASRWCHKPGHTAARNTDNSGSYITNPQTCDRGFYTTWGGEHMFSNGVRSRVVQ